jgi:hypothetical protein
MARASSAEERLKRNTMSWLYSAGPPLPPWPCRSVLLCDDDEAVLLGPTLCELGSGQKREMSALESHRSDDVDDEAVVGLATTTWESGAVKRRSATELRILQSQRAAAETRDGDAFEHC